MESEKSESGKNRSTNTNSPIKTNIKNSAGIAATGFQFDEDDDEEPVDNSQE